MRSPRPRRWRNPRRTRISRILPAPQTCNFIVFSTPDRIQGSAGGFPFRASAASRTPAGPAAFGRRRRGHSPPPGPPLSGRAALRAAFPPRQLAAFSPRGTAQAKSPPFPPVRGPAAAPLLTQHKKKKCSHRLTGAQNVGTIYLVNYEIWGNCHGSKSKKGIRQ